MKTHETIWVVTEVWRGFPVSAHAFRNPEKALICEQQIRARINLLEDETDIFEVQLEIAPEEQARGESAMSEKLAFHGRAIKSGRGEGPALVSTAPIGFLGGVDPDTGIVLEPGHPLQGQSVAGKVLVFPSGKGSTVGSYTILRLSRGGHGPAAMVNAESEAIVAVGAIIADIPMVDRVDITQIRDGDWVVVEDGIVIVTRQK